MTAGTGQAALSPYRLFSFSMELALSGLGFDRTGLPSVLDGLPRATVPLPRANLLRGPDLAKLGRVVNLLDQRPASSLPLIRFVAGRRANRDSARGRVNYISRMVGDFYTTLRWRLLRGFMLWLYGPRCMRCGSTYRVEVDHIIARARGEFGRAHQWMPRNLQILCHQHNQEKMTKFDDWRPLWARVLMPVRDTPAAYHAETQPALGSHQYHSVYATAPMRMVQLGRPHPLPSCPDRTSEEEGNTQPSCAGLLKACKSDPEPVDQGDAWASPVALGRLAWDIGVVLAVVSLLLLVARIVGHCVGFKWRW
jgi:hypothetical protein